jgi:hypothetical protein
MSLGATCSKVKNWGAHRRGRSADHRAQSSVIGCDGEAHDRNAEEEGGVRRSGVATANLKVELGGWL